MLKILLKIRDSRKLSVPKELYVFSKSINKYLMVGIHEALNGQDKQIS
jgi:hypothetical protein